MELNVVYRNNKEFGVSCRGHEITVDLPQEKGGKDKGVMPPELLVASLATCMGVYVQSYCRNAGINAEGLSLSAKWEPASDPARIGNIDVEIKLPNLKDKVKEHAILKAAEHCMVHNTFHNLPLMTAKLVG